MHCCSNYKLERRNSSRSEKQETCKIKTRQGGSFLYRNTAIKGIVIIDTNQYYITEYSSTLHHIG